jgi:hypothetical protein
MRAAGVTSQGTIKRVVIRYNDRLKSHGVCKKRGAMVIIELRERYNIKTLAHEIRHLAQHTVGLSDVMTYERETVEQHNLRAHEIDAIEFAKRYA